MFSNARQETKRILLLLFTCNTYNVHNIMWRSSVKEFFLPDSAILFRLRPPGQRSIPQVCCTILYCSSRPVQVRIGWPQLGWSRIFSDDVFVQNGRPTLTLTIIRKLRRITRFFSSTLIARTLCNRIWHNYSLNQVIYTFYGQLKEMILYEAFYTLNWSYNSIPLQSRITQVHGYSFLRTISTY